MTTIRSRCRLVVLRTPPAEAIADMLSAEGVAPDRALTAAGRAPHAAAGRDGAAGGRPARCDPLARLGRARSGRLVPCR